MKMSKLLLKNTVIALGMTVAAANSYAGDIYKFGGKTYNDSNLNSATRQAIYDADFERFKNIEQIIDGAILEQHIADIAAKQKKDPAAVAQELLNVSEPTEKEMKEWFEKNKERIPYPFDKIKNEIARMLSGEKQNEKRTKLLAEVKKKGDYKLLMQAPIAPTFQIDTTGYPSKGSKSAKVTVVEFADYQCPHCKEASEMMTSVMAKLGDKMQLVYMDYPFNRSGISKKVAEGGVCADKQGKYWEYHDKAFGMQKDLTMDSPVAIAKELKLDVTQFEKCIVSDEAVKKVQASFDLGNKIGVRGTPTFFLNGQKVDAHAHTVDEWAELIKPYL